MKALRGVFPGGNACIAVPLNKIMLRDDFDILQRWMDSMIVKPIIQHTDHNAGAIDAEIVHIDDFDVGQLSQGRSIVEVCRRGAFLQ